MLHWLWDAVGSTVLQLLAELLVLLLTVAAGYAIRYLKLLGERQKQDILSAARARFASLAQQIVLATESTAASALRKAVADGQVSRDELKALGEEAAQKLLRTLDDQARQALQASVRDLYELARSEIEAQLQTLKASGVIPTVASLQQAQASPN